MDDAKHENAMQWHLRSVHAVVNVKFNEDWNKQMAPMKTRNASQMWWWWWLWWCGGCLQCLIFTMHLAVQAAETWPFNNKTVKIKVMASQPCQAQAGFIALALSTSVSLCSYCIHWMDSNRTWILKKFLHQSHFIHSTRQHLALNLWQWPKVLKLCAVYIGPLFNVMVYMPFALASPKRF